MNMRLSVIGARVGRFYFLRETWIVCISFPPEHTGRKIRIT